MRGRRFRQWCGVRLAQIMGALTVSIPIRRYTGPVRARTIEVVTTTARAFRHSWAAIDRPLKRPLYSAIHARLPNGGYQAKTACPP